MNEIVNSWNTLTGQQKEDTWDTLTEENKTAIWEHEMKTFWSTLTEKQKNHIQEQLSLGVVSPEVTNDNGQRAYIDDLRTNEDGTFRVIGQLA